MASFATHLYGAALVSSVAALALHSTGLTGPQQTQTFFFLGIAGGLLPDIDSDASKPVRGFFTLLAVALAFFVAFALVGRLRLLDVSLVWVATFLAVRFGVFEAFAHFTVHRGVWHSWLAVALADRGHGRWGPPPGRHPSQGGLDGRGLRCTRLPDPSLPG